MNKRHLLAMVSKSTATALKSCTVAILLVVFLFANGLWELSNGFIGSALREAASIFRDPKTQWMVFLCLGIYFTAFLFLRIRVNSDFSNPSTSKAGQAVFSPPWWPFTRTIAHGVTCPTFWLTCTLIICAVDYTLNYSTSIDALTLLAGAMLGQGVAAWANFEIRNRLGVLVLSLLVILLALASVWDLSPSHFFEYRGYTRWSGPWDNPNIAGLLMGVGVSLALGLGVSRWKTEVGKLEMTDKSLGGRVRKYAVVILFSFAAILMARGLLHGYSRGAWVATGLGLTYLLWQWINFQIELRKTFLRPSCISWFNKNWLSLSAILLSVVVLSFWHFRQTEWHPAHRAFSVSNQNDFSWRNRIAAWEGALQMVAEKPWFGFGWNQPELIYDHYYRAPKVAEGMAIQSNDCLILGATLGIPALFCFVAYIWLSLTQKSDVKTKRPKLPPSDFGFQISDFLPAICRAGTIVLLVGFWFDGGLFKLPTAASFWILLELGAVKSPQKAAKGPKSESFK